MQKVQAHVRTPPVQGRINKIYDHLYANAPMKTPSAIAHEFGKVAHAVLYIEKKLGRIPAFAYSQRDERALASGQKTLATSYSDEIRHAFGLMRLEWALYDEDEAIKLSDFDITYCAINLGGMVLSDPKVDTLGEIFEIIRSQFAKEKGGQFFTDPQVTHLAMALLEFDPLNGDDLVDICAGTGGFLLAGMAHLEERLAATSAGPEALRTIIERQFIGVEIDEDAAAAANSTVRSRLGHGVADVVHAADSLRLREGNGQPRLRFGSHRCAATNPPFGTKITVKDQAVLRNFELSRLGLGGRLAPLAPDALFLEQNLKLIAPEVGRLAIVVPYQMLSGPQAARIRDWLIRNAQIHAVIDLPGETFQPHTGTKGALLVVSRRSRPLRSAADAKDDRVFMATPRHVGHDRRGNAVYKKGTQSNELLTDFPAVKEAFEQFRKGGAPEDTYSECFTVSIDEIVGSELLNLNAAYFKYASRALALSATVIATGNWKTRKLRDVTSRIFFPGRFKRNYVGADGGGVPFLGGASISELHLTGGKWLSADDPKLEMLLVESGWLLVTRSGSTGIVSTVPQSWDGYAVSEHVIRIVPNQRELPASYLFAVLSSEYGQSYLKQGVFGSVIDEISPEFIGDLEVPIPTDPAVLQAIAGPIEAAEVSRNEAIVGFSSGIAGLEAALKGTASKVGPVLAPAQASGGAPAPARSAKRHSAAARVGAGRAS